MVYSDTPTDLILLAGHYDIFLSLSEFASYLSHCFRDLNLLGIVVYCDTTVDLILLEGDLDLCFTVQEIC